MTETKVETVNVEGYTADLSNAGVVIDQNAWNQAHENIKNANRPCLGGSTFLGAFTDPTFYIFLVPAIVAFILGLWWGSEYRQRGQYGNPLIFFAIIWAILYLLISYTAYQGYYLGSEQQQKWILFLFYVTIVVLILWSYLYFVAMNPGAAFVTLIVAFILGLFLMCVLYQIQPSNAWLFGIYVLWLLICLFVSLGQSGYTGVGGMKWY